MRRLLFSISCAACLLFALGGRAFVQQPPAHIKGNVNSVPDATRHQAGEGEDDQTTPQDELLKTIEIRRSEATYKENLERAREAALLSADVREAFKRQNSLGAVETKKLARIEKLARSIRNAAGGDDDDATLPDPPASLGAAIERLAEMCEDFRKKVEKTPRHVVSAAVITSANQLIELTRLIKTLGG
jgi:hypothetical protein